jgi:hypothetical protein
MSQCSTIQLKRTALRSNLAAQYRAASHQKQSRGSRGMLSTNAPRDRRPQPVRQDLSIAPPHEPCLFLAQAKFRPSSVKSAFRDCVEDRSLHAAYISVLCAMDYFAARDRTSDPCKVSSNLEKHTVAPRRGFLLDPNLLAQAIYLRCALLALLRRAEGIEQCPSFGLFSLRPWLCENAVGLL